MKPTRTTTKRTKQIINRHGPFALIDSRMKKLTAKDIDDINDILQQFEIWDYNASSPYPDPRLCHFWPFEYN